MTLLHFEAAALKLVGVVAAERLCEWRSKVMQLFCMFEERVGSSVSLIWIPLRYYFFCGIKFHLNRTSGAVLSVCVNSMMFFRLSM